MTTEKSREDLLRERLEAARAKRADLAAERDLSGLEQQVADEEKRLELDQSYPDGYASVELNNPLAGFPGFVAARDCTRDEYKRHQSQVKVKVVGKAAEVDNGDAPAQLGRSCLIYPDRETFAKMLELRPGLDSGLGQEVVSRAQARKAEDAKK